MRQTSFLAPSPEQEVRDLVQRLAEHLAFFQRSKRFGDLHIGRDMELCHVGGWFGGEGPQTECSPRCQAVRLVLDDAAAYLGVELAAFRSVPRRKR